MKIEGNIKFLYNSAENAKLVYHTLEIDNEKFLESLLRNNTVEYKIYSDKPGTFIRTADDLISSETVVEKILKKLNDEKFYINKKNIY